MVAVSCKLIAYKTHAAQTPVTLDPQLIAVEPVCPSAQFIRGMYRLFLEVWLRHLPRSHVLVLKAEDYFSDSMGTLQKVGAGVGAAEEGGREGGWRCWHGGEGGRRG